jgi:hypothetical protein
MKRLSMLGFFFVLLAGSVAAQKAPTPQIELHRLVWVEAGYPSCDTCLAEPQTAVAYYTRRFEKREFQWFALAKLRNLGPRAIKSMDLDFVFTSIATKEEFLRYRLHSDRQIKPGAEKDISRRIRDAKFEGGNYNPTQPGQAILSRATLAWPVNAPIVNRGRVRPTDLLSLEIVRVEYADGSVWQKP